MLGGVVIDISFDTVGSVTVGNNPFFVVMSVFIPFSVSHLFHQRCGGVTEMKGDGIIGMFLDILFCPKIGGSGTVGFGCGCEIDRPLREGVIGFGHSNKGDGSFTALAIMSARGSAFPISSLAKMIMRRTMKRGSSPASIIFASQKRVASGSLPLIDLMKAETVS